MKEISPKKENNKKGNKENLKIDNNSTLKK